jgi:hypothetical protein
MRNGRVRVILCEGACSRTCTYDETDVLRLRAAGYTAEEIRGEMSAKMRHTSHQYVERRLRPNNGGYELIYACLVCSHERTYGVEEF